MKETKIDLVQVEPTVNLFKTETPKNQQSKLSLQINNGEIKYVSSKAQVE